MATERPLTAGETELARSIFGGAVDFARVRLVHGKWWPFQPAGVVMAPMGKIHFHPHGDSWSDDFAHDDLAAQGLFIHEMTHVWQAQAMGRFYLPLMRHPFCRYAYRFAEGRPLARYGLEQQAEVVRHVFLLRRHYPLHGVPPLAKLEAILPFRPEPRA